MRLVGTIVAIAAIPYLAPAADPWTTHYGNGRHDGYVPLTIDPSQLALRWSKQLDAQRSTPISAASISASTACLTTVAPNAPTSASLWCLDEGTGAQRWAKFWPDILTASQPTVAGGRVYVQTQGIGFDTRLRAFDLGTGARAFEQPATSRGFDAVAPLLLGGSAYLGGNQGQLYDGALHAFDATTGSLRFSTTGLPGYDRWTAATDGSRLYLYLGPGAGFPAGLHGVDAVTGSPVAFIEDPAYGASSYPSDTTVLGSQNDAVTTALTHLVSFDLSAGAVRWLVPGWYWGTPVVANGVVYARAGFPSAIEARAETDGALLWSWRDPGNGEVDMIVTDGHLIASVWRSTMLQTTEIVDLATGQTVWSFPFGSSIALTEDTLFVGDAEYSTLHAIGLRGVCLDVSPASLPDGVLDQPYSQLLTASGGGPATFSVPDPAMLPPGLTLDSAGRLYGTPTAIGRHSFTVVADDGSGCVGGEFYTLGIGTGTDYVSGAGHGAPNPNRVRVHTAGGSPTSVDFLAYSSGGWGVNVAAASIDGGSQPRLLTGPGPGSGFGPHVRAFDRGGIPLARVSFYAYGSLNFGSNVTAGALDADAPSEILTGPGPGDAFGPHVRGWNYDGVALTAVARVNFFAYQTLRFGANVAAGDLDADGYGELLTAPGPGPIFAPHIRGFDFDGVAVRSIGRVSFVAHAPTAYGANLSTGNFDADGFDEIVTALGPGPDPQFTARILGWDYDGAGIAQAFATTSYPTTYFGARVGLSDLDEDGDEEVFVGAGPDPAAGSTVRTYDSGRYLLPNAFEAFEAYAYGVSATGAALGY